MTQQASVNAPSVLIVGEHRIFALYRLVMSARFPELTGADSTLLQSSELIAEIAANLRDTLLECKLRRVDDDTGQTKAKSSWEQSITARAGDQKWLILVNRCADLYAHVWAGLSASDRLKACNVAIAPFTASGSEDLFVTHVGNAISVASSKNLNK